MVTKAVGLGWVPYTQCSLSRRGGYIVQPNPGPSRLSLTAELGCRFRLSEEWWDSMHLSSPAWVWSSIRSWGSPWVMALDSISISAMVVGRRSQCRGRGDSRSSSCLRYCCTEPVKRCRICTVGSTFGGANSLGCGSCGGKRKRFPPFQPSRVRNETGARGGESCWCTARRSSVWRLTYLRLPVWRVQGLVEDGGCFLSWATRTRSSQRLTKDAVNCLHDAALMGVN